MTLPSDNPNNLLEDPTGTPPAGEPPKEPPANPPAGEPPANPPAGEPPKTQSFEDLKNSLPDDLKAREEIKRLSSFEDMAKGLVEKNKMLSSSVRIPDANAPKEEIVKFYEKLGKPDKPEAYELNPPEELIKQGYPLNTELADAFRKRAFDNNLTKEQTEKLYQGFIEDQKNEYDQAKAEGMQKAQEAKDNLLKEWGDKYTTNIEFIKNRLDSLYSKETQTILAQTGLFGNPTVLKDLYKLTKSISGDTVFIDGKHIENPKETIESLSTQRDQLMREDFLKNKPKIDELNLRIVQLKEATKGRIQ